jgi:hypothetical protein
MKKKNLKEHKETKEIERENSTFIHNFICILKHTGKRIAEDTCSLKEFGIQLLKSHYQCRISKTIFYTSKTFSMSPAKI